MTFNKHIQTLGVVEDGGIILNMVQTHLRAACLRPLGWRKALGLHLHGESKSFLGPSKEGVSRVGTTLPAHSSHNFSDVLFLPQSEQIHTCPSLLIMNG